MGQVPHRILVIGDGRLATTLKSVFQPRTSAKPGTSIAAAPLELATWSRRSDVSLSEFLQNFDASHVWLAISDRAIADFVQQHSKLWKNRIVVHFAGSLPKTGDAHAAHPLTTFSSSQPITPEEFAKIPFVLDLEGPPLNQLIPGAANTFYRINPSDRAYYHALCSIAGNFSVLLWESVANRFNSNLGLTPQVLDVFRAQIFSNLADAARVKPQRASVLTGPLVRGDVATLETHRRALLARSEIPLLKIYDSFTDLYRTECAKETP